jgi:hypothetical protein
VAAPGLIKKLRKPRQETLETETVARCLDLIARAPQLDAVLVEVSETDKYASEPPLRHHPNRR